MATTEQSRKIEVKIEPGAESVIRIVAVPPVRLNLRVVSFKARGRQYKLRLEGTHQNLTPPPGKAAKAGEAPTCSVGFKTRTYGIDRACRVEGVPIQFNGQKCTVELEVDVFEAGMFGKGRLEMTVTPDFPFAPECKVDAAPEFDSPLNVEGVGVEPGDKPPSEPAAPPPPGATPGKKKAAGKAAEADNTAVPGLKVLLGQRLELEPVIGSAFEKATLRLSIFEEGALTARRSMPPALTTFEWTSQLDDERVWRVGHAESDETLLLTYLETRQESYGYDLRCEITDENEKTFTVWERPRGLTFPRPQLKSLRVGHFGVEAEVANIAPGFKLPLELSLWSHDALTPGSPLHVMEPCAESTDAETSSSEFFLELLRPSVWRKEKKVFALLRIPRTLSGTEDYVPVSAVMDYDENTHLTFDDDQLWLEPPKKGKQQAKAKKTPKELATAVASEELKPGTLLTRAPHFGEVTAGVRDNQLLFSFRLVGDEQYWKDAAPAFSLYDQDGKSELMKLATQPMANNSRVLEALVPLADKRVLGQKLSVRGQLTKPEAKWWSEPVAPPEFEPRTYEAVPLLSRLSRRQVELTDETTYIQLRCHARHVPNGKQGTELAFRVYEIVADLDMPIRMSGVKLRYTPAKGQGGLCDARGWWTARITDKESLEKLNGPGRFRIEACVDSKDEKVHSLDVPRIHIDFGGTPNKVAGQLIWGKVVSDEFRKKVFAISRDLKVDPQDLMACMAFETGGKFKADTPGKSSGAVGLIQFIPGKNDQILKKTTAELKAMTEVEQLDYVQLYLRHWMTAKKKQFTSLGDIYASIIWPEGIGQPGDSVYFAAGHPAYEPNAGLDRGKKGYVTKDDATAPVQKWRDDGWEHRR